MKKEKERGAKSAVRPTNAEFERRIAFVEQLIISGKAQSMDQIIGLLEDGLHVEVNEGAARHYLQAAEKRVGEATAEVQKARREWLFRMEMRNLERMAAKLRDANVIPTYSEYITALEKAFLRYDKRVGTEYEADEAPVVDPESLDAKRDPELDKLVVEMLEANASTRH